jgi:UDP-glucose 4-epimerase
MTFTILGANGFIGSKILSKAGNNAIGLTHKSANLLKFDSIQKKLCEYFSNSYIIYCAGIHRQKSDTFATLIDNQRMINNVISIMEVVKPKGFVFLSSVEVYGIPSSLPITELTTIQPFYNYAIGKYSCELLLSKFCREARIPLTILRLPGVYGPSDNGTSIITKLVRSTNGVNKFKLFGNGNDLRDYIYVDDVADASINLALSNRQIITVNLATGINHSVIELINLVSEEFNTCQIEKIESESSHFDLIFNINKLSALLPNFKPIEVMEGIKNYKS